jgi:hypothetical protein
MKARAPERGVNQSRGQRLAGQPMGYVLCAWNAKFIVVQYPEFGSGFRKRLRARVFMMPNYRND